MPAPTSTTTRRPALLATTAVLSAVGVTAAVAGVALPNGDWTNASGAGAAPVPPVTSPNVSYLGTVPETGAISLEFARTGDFAYVSSTDTITVLDLTDPRAPKARGSLVNAMFENESMTYGERVDEQTGELTRFVIAAIDLYQASPEDVEHINLIGNEFLVVDVTDPDDPFIRSRATTSTSTHTVQCLSQANCTTAYTAGFGSFSVLDFTDLDAPREVKVVESPGAAPNDLYFGTVPTPAGHYWDFDGVVGWHSGSGGVTAYDVSDPHNPVPVNGTDANGRADGWNDFIMHNSRRPNGDVMVDDAPPSVFNGNVLLVTEEDYAETGEELVCSETGSFQTWHLPRSLRLEGYAGADTGDITPLQRVTPDQLGGGLTTPAAAFCSAHWFDYHQDGFVAQGWYGSGLRILDVKDADAIAQVGHATTGVTEVFDAYWVPVRDENGVVTDQKTNLVYTADTTRGIDVYEVTLPELTDEQKAAKAAMEARRAAAQSAGRQAPPGCAHADEHSSRSAACGSHAPGSSAAAH